MEKVVFVGAGPGAPDLLTIRGKNIIADADVVIYAGSLVNPGILSYCKEGAEIYDSASMTLKEITDVLAEAAKAGKKTARIHTGDPSIYGAEREQMRELDRLGIPYEIVPGVSSFLAAAASIKREYTLPGVSQSVILTRMEGRTAVPEGESIESLAAHQASMVIFLSVGEIEALTEKLIAGGYTADTPAAVVYKASWEDEKQVFGTLADIASKVREAGIEKTALVMAGRFLSDDFENSRLYDETFSHGFRKALADSAADRDAMAERLMIQGTMSGAGKSFVAAALCRIFRQDGYRAAPFKSQNMALNSYVTEEGLEMGRAQVMQAEAAGIKPEAAMNPILLKPTGDEESQVIVRGEVVGNMSASEYYQKKADLMPLIKDSFDQLAGGYDIVVIEGAGSPAEINLKENDIVNMGMAAMADAPVILVADIDRGGVFAQIVGTVELLGRDERERVKGIIINKFRGDVNLLRPGIEPIEKMLGIPVLGVIPMERIDLDEEDSLAPRLENKGYASRSGSVAAPDAKDDKKTLNIAVIRLPHISNFTDFSVLERWEGLKPAYVTEKDELSDADLIILPGTKNTMGDLEWLRETGLADMIKDMSENAGVLVIGICGGYQILGERLCDPEGVEGRKGASTAGLGLLPVTTIFASTKTRTRSAGVLTEEAAGMLSSDLSGKPLKGYEIHMGKTFISPGPADGDTKAVSERKEEAVSERKAGKIKNCLPFMTLDDGRQDGFIRADGSCLGTYMHGLFDNIDFTFNLLSAIGAKCGVTVEKPDEDVAAYKERQFDRLADLVRGSLDMDAVYRILRESGRG